MVNVLWGMFNLVVAYVLVARVGRFDLRQTRHVGCPGARDIGHGPHAGTGIWEVSWGQPLMADKTDDPLFDAMAEQWKHIVEGYLHYKDGKPVMLYDIQEQRIYAYQYEGFKDGTLGDHFPADWRVDRLYTEAEKAGNEVSEFASVRGVG